MKAGDKIHHIEFGYGLIELVLTDTECLAYFKEFGGRDKEQMYRDMEEIYGRAFERVPNQALQLVQAKHFHNCTATGVY